MGSQRQRELGEKGKALLEKYNIPFDMSNYNNQDGYIKAGDKGYKFWFDPDKQEYMTDAPEYEGKEYLDPEELMSYVFDIKDMKDKYKEAFGDAFEERSKPNPPKEEETVDDYERYLRELRQYRDKNPKGRDDIPVATRR